MWFFLPRKFPENSSSLGERLADQAIAPSALVLVVIDTGFVIPIPHLKIEMWGTRSGLVYTRSDA
ncbi:hypothetical protein HNQ77_000420 [Silvibacterium bohemicum]|uniref:Uncharacterized protein n=1 Tax=Silvibacterium bohemicum TaxID=1577686 RepID=A0A841JM79_9BACT|nr:hypothetical protein [Silvibacterium bohemicum]MBB6142482.1 hypothetical protein [Silvibacterium bohemicum]